MSRYIKTKSGAASFYIVMITTLILTVLAMSFTSLVITEVQRTANNDLSNSAYDSALAGIEDAKLAFLAYQSCLNQGATASGHKDTGELTCADIVYYMENPNCDMVARILKRIRKEDAGQEVLIRETTNGNNSMEQAYTCVQIKTKLDDYRANLSSSNSAQLIPMSLDKVDASNIKSVRISWYSDNNGTDFNYDNNESFAPAKTNLLATPPTIAVQLLQTATTFSLSQFSTSTDSGTTDRGTLYFVATQNRGTAHRYNGINNNMEDAGFYDITSDNIVTLSDSQNFALSNNQKSKNVPILTYCPKNSGMEFACSVVIDLPEPVGGSRNSDTFMLLVSLPYGGPDTEISVEACTANAGQCNNVAYSAQSTSNKAQFQNIQVSIDSTGRANTLYRRVMTRLETNDIYYSYPFSAIQVFGSDDTATIKKTVTTTAEWGL